MAIFGHKRFSLSRQEGSELEPKTKNLQDRVSWMERVEVTHFPKPTSLKAVFDTRHTESPTDQTSEGVQGSWLKLQYRVRISTSPRISKSISTGAETGAVCPAQPLWIGPAKITFINPSGC
ncbi:hypothetical protein PSHT_01332 [Puccinia striiformis]|uniref:Uncharacterized protein n=3 Tax=Puccinia striiformis TaxID=27350 RepID=A0A0L0V9M9_9BASI|nr:hypothetical protein KEM48_009332 [Puccinia striiformis f. sp. tritici PST-130]KNE95911.1 hypothetical protein PSTG_10828 [Puccinia striiformis f. sp. tritici PST-78]POW01946.1 hypothetical protein PSTT_12141 [Puccinia striiformis]POW22401.1 hypothetical protein PSHT_01332 [Puccinia striiformis]